MKKIFIVLAVSAFALSSCKKDFECDCHVHYNDGTPHEDFEYDIKNSKKSEAEDICHDFEHDLEKLPNVEKVHCHLD